MNNRAKSQNGFPDKKAANVVASVLTLIFASFSLILVLQMACPMKNVKADGYYSNGYYKNYDTGYIAVISDLADYLPDDENDELIEVMKDLTDYTNVIYLTDENNKYATESYSESIAEEAAHGFFGTSANVVVYVVDNEYDYIYAQGNAMKTITSSRAYNITDNVYMYSADGEYLTGAKEAFSECLKLFKGKKISNKMKYICNAFVALFISSLVCYTIISRKSKLKYTGGSELIKGAICYAEISAPVAIFSYSQKTYSPRSSSGGGHGGGGHGGGHSGGHSGGGHSH